MLMDPTAYPRGDALDPLGWCHLGPRGPLF